MTQIKHKSEVVKQIPKDLLEAVSVFGNVQITTQSVSELLRRGISVNLFSSKGTYFGRIESTQQVNSGLLRQQVHASENLDFVMGISKKIILSKAHNQKILLNRYFRSTGIDISVEVQNITASIKNIDRCDSISQLIGYEGIISKFYFQAIAKMINPNFRFHGRVRRPPTDPFNSMLSLGYTLLMYEICSAIQSRGLTPYIGFIH